MNDAWPVTNDELKAANCWFGADRVPGEPEVTEFKRRARWHQCHWRIAHELPIGSHRRGGSTWPNGSKIPYDPAHPLKDNFLSGDIVAMVEHRIENPQRHQTFDRQRLWSDLLSSMPMCFNLFGEAAADPERLQSAVAALWPALPGPAVGLTFEWSPGRRRPREFLNNATAFDAAIHLDLGDGTEGVIGIETKYHEHIQAEETPNGKTRMPRYRDVTEASGVFKPGWEQAIVGTALQQIWLDHLLVLSMPQHRSERWSWGRFVLVYPAANPSVRAAAERYREVLADDATFEVRTIQELLEPGVLHTPETATKFRDRYLWDLDEPLLPPAPPTADSSTPGAGNR